MLIGKHEEEKLIKDIFEFNTREKRRKEMFFSSTNVSEPIPYFSRLLFLESTSSLSILVSPIVFYV